VADFCYDCTGSMWGDINAERNDFVRAGDGATWYRLTPEVLWPCEGCGLHAFTPEGKRACGRPQSDFEAEDGYAYMVPCAECVERVALEPEWPEP
jgi:hypothetical protein